MSETTIQKTLRPSSLERAALCPGSAMMEAMTENPPETPQADAERGTDFHAVISAYLAGKEPSEIDGFDDFADQLLWAVEAADIEIANARIPPDALRLIEKRVDLSGYGLSGNCGTVDLGMVVEFERGIVIDWKSGYRPQSSAPNNIQLMCYAVGLADAFFLNRVDVSLVEAGIKNVTRHTYDEAALDAARLKIRRIVVDANRFDAPLVPGPRQCKYCKAAFRCDALRTSFDATANYKNMSGQQATELLDAAVMAHVWANAVNQYANAVMFAKHAAGEPLDFGMYEKKIGREGNRKWKETVTKSMIEAALDAVKPGASEEVDIQDHRIKSPTSIAELLKALGLKGKAADAAISGMVERKPGQPVLVRRNGDGI